MIRGGRVWSRSSTVGALAIKMAAAPLSVSRDTKPVSIDTTPIDLEPILEQLERASRQRVNRLAAKILRARK